MMGHHRPLEAATHGAHGPHSRLSTAQGFSSATHRRAALKRLAHDLVRMLNVLDHPSLAPVHQHVVSARAPEKGEPDLCSADLVLHDRVDVAQEFLQHKAVEAP